ncbi:MAG: hypothetical protein IPH62_19340 [Ignavibacteriae bacterium]|nr:hypothetical protein [Ignavibacteriota bacterium]
MKSILNMIAFITLLVSSITYSQTGKDGLKVSNQGVIEYLVEDVSTDGKAIGLTKERIISKLELSIRLAKIRPIKSKEALDGYLYVNINVVGNAFTIELNYNRYVAYFYGSGKKTQHQTVIATTWSNSITGSLGGGSSEFIVNTLQSSLDEFLNDFLAANN